MCARIRDGRHWLLRITSASSSWTPIRLWLETLRTLSKRISEFHQPKDGKVKPFTAERTYELAEAHAGLGHEELAVTWMYRTLQLQPNHQKANRWLANYFEKKQDRAKA